MSSSPAYVDRDDAMIARIVDGLAQTEADIAALEAERVVQLALAMRVALDRAQHRPRAVQEREMHVRSIAAEIAVALRWNDRTTQRRMGEAIALLDDFPETLRALGQGRITAAHARVIVDAGMILADDNERAAYEEVAVERAANDTVARTRAFVRLLIEELHPESITDRFERAEHARRVWVDDAGEGMGELTIHDSIAKVRAMYDRLTRQAHAVRAAAAPDTDDDPDAVHDTRSLDQIRADLACDLILTGQPAIDPATDVLPGGLGAIRAHVSVMVPALTAAGVDDRGAILDGVSPVDADTARCLMATAPGWDRILTHPVTGVVLAVDRYRPGPTMQRFLAARDIHCRFPGCRQPARVCDLDHNEDWALGGPTALGNLACLCKRHHTLKTETPWKAHQDRDGTIRWTSPLGRTTADPPERYVAFVPDGDPPPF